MEIDSRRVGNYTVRVMLDEGPSIDPRDHDGLATFVGYHRNYIVPNEAHLSRNTFEDLTMEEIGSLLRYECHALVMLPVFMYDYQGSYTTRGEVGDSNQVGFIFATAAQLREWGCLNDGQEITSEITANVEEQLRAEVEEYSQWAQGNVYGYVIETAIPTYSVQVNGRGEGKIKKVKKGKRIDSSWGFIGDPDYCMSEGVAVAEKWEE